MTVSFRRGGLLLALGLLSTGCIEALNKSADFDRHRYSRLVQPRNEPDKPADKIYFDVIFNADYPVDNPVAEASRMQWVQGWLDQRHLCPGGFEVTLRRPFDYLEDNPAGYQQRWEIRCSVLSDQPA